MLALYFRGNGQIELRDVPRPTAKGTEVVVRVRAASICGSDREPLSGEGQRSIPGHELAGEVAEADRTTSTREGDRVAINCHVTCGHCEHCHHGDLFFCPELEVIGIDRDGGYAEYVLVPERCCMPLPDDLSYDTGALMVDMLGTAYHAVKRAHLMPGDFIAIWGAGPIGLATLLVAKQYGVRATSIDLNGYRLRMASQLGADHILNPHSGDAMGMLLDLTHGRGVDAAFECAGNETAVLQALDIARKRGKVVLIGVSHKVGVNPWEHFIRKELMLYGSRNFNMREYEEMLLLVRRGLPIDAIITHRFPLTEAKEAFDVFSRGNCGKVIISPWVGVK